MDQEGIYLILYSLDSSGMSPALEGIVLQPPSPPLDVLSLRSTAALKDEVVSEMSSQ